MPTPPSVDEISVKDAVERIMKEEIGIYGGHGIPDGVCGIDKAATRIAEYIDQQIKNP